MKKITSFIKKNPLIAIGIFSITALIIYLIVNNKNKIKEKMEDIKDNEGNANKIGNSPVAVFNKLKNEYKNNMDKLKLLNATERVYRLESAHFNSNIYNKTKGAGVIAVNTAYPYGWSLPRKVWEETGKPEGLYKSSNGFSYVVFKNLEQGVRTTMAILEGYNKQGHNTGRYLSAQNANTQKEYIEKLNKLKDSNLFTQSFEDNKYLKYF